MIGIESCWPINELIILFDGVIVCNRHRLVMGDKKAKLWSWSRTPRFDHCIHSRLLKINCIFRSKLVVSCIWRSPLFMCSPPKFRWLVKSFWDETINRPGIPKMIYRLYLWWSLSVPFCNMNPFNFKSFHEWSPLFSRLWLFSFGSQNTES